MKLRYARNLKTGSIETQSRGTEGNQADLDVMRSNMIGDGANGLTPADVEVGWMEKDEINKLHKVFAEKVFDAKSYNIKRSREYPPMSDQLDMLWHAMDTGILPKVDSFYDINKSIKEKYPKE
jgi:hypothetical protein